MKFLITLVVLAAIGYGGWIGYEKFQSSRSDQDIAESLMQSKNYEDAIPHLERARRQQPGNTAVVLMLAECYDRNGQKQQAAACYRSVEPTLNDASQAVSLRRAKERYAVLRASGY